MKMLDELFDDEKESLCKCKVLYLGSKEYYSKDRPSGIINLKQLQGTIGSRYPIDHNKYAKGIETCLTVSKNGIKIEHVTNSDKDIKGYFYYPIRSLAYCGALRFIEDDDGNWRFVALDASIASEDRNIKNPPLFVLLMKSIEPNNVQKIECHVFVTGMKKSAMRLVESCQNAYNITKFNLSDFLAKYTSIPVVVSYNGAPKDSLRDIKIPHQKGFFYTFEERLIDYFQLFDSDEEKTSETFSEHVFRSEPEDASVPNKMSTHDEYTYEIEEREIDPYEEAPYLVKVEKRVDPESGQNIYIRWFAKPTGDFDASDIEIEKLTKGSGKTPIVIKEIDKSPSPIIIEKIVKKKKPKVIIKEIHVDDPTEEVIEVVKEDRRPTRSHEYARRNDRIYSRRRGPPPHEFDYDYGYDDYIYRSHHHHNNNKFNTLQNGSRHRYSMHPHLCHPRGCSSNQRGDEAKERTKDKEKVYTRGRSALPGRTGSDESLMKDREAQGTRESRKRDTIRIKNVAPKARDSYELIDKIDRMFRSSSSTRLVNNIYKVPKMNLNQSSKQRSPDVQIRTKRDVKYPMENFLTTNNISAAKNSLPKYYNSGFITNLNQPYNGLYYNQVPQMVPMTAKVPHMTQMPYFYY